MPLLAISLAILPVAAAAQVAPTSTAPRHSISPADTVKFLAGNALALALHEGGHLLMDGIFDAEPRLKRVTFGPFPFFAIAHRDLPPKQEFVVSSAGFWVQHATSEWLLTARPGVAPLLKGLLAFNVLASIGYGGVAMAKAGPPERDTRGMAASARIDERAIGILVLAPAILDAYRYVRPAARWAAWTSRATKAGMVLLVLR